MSRAYKLEDQVAQYETTSFTLIALAASCNMAARRDVSTPFVEDDWGMKVLYEPKEEVQTEHEIIEQVNQCSPSPVMSFANTNSFDSIIAVHGLMGHRIKSWTHPMSGKMWLRDFLPSTIPFARIMTYGYDADPRSPNTLATRKRCCKPSTLKEGPRLRHKPDEICCAYIIGLNGSPWRPANGLGYSFSNGIFLLLIQHRYYYISAKESNKTKAGFFRRHLIVAPESAVLNAGQREQQFSIPGADHRQVCKFGSLNGGTYRIISSSLRSMAEGAAKPIPKPDLCKYFMVPDNLSAHFVGRDDEHKMIRDTLQSPQSSFRRVPLYGMTGVGKTQLAYAYATENKRNYMAVFFITSSTTADIGLRYSEIYNTLQLPRRVANDQKGQINEVKQWLDRNPNWLLIFDDVQEEWYNAFTEFLPPRKGHILITTRSERAAKTFAEGSRNLCLHVKELNLEPAVDLLLLAGSQRTDDEDLRAVAREVAKELGNLPVVLEFTGRGYRSKTQLQEVLADLRDADMKRRFILDHKDHIVGYTAAGISNVSIHQVLQWTVERLEPETAKRIWYVTAFLNPAWIARLFFAELPDESEESLRMLASNPQKTRNGLTQMWDLGLTSLAEGSDDYWIHDLIHAANRASLDHEQTAQYSTFATRWILAGFPDYGKFGKWDHGRNYLKHALSCRSWMSTLNLSNRALGNLFSKASDFARFTGAFELAEDLGRDALKVSESHTEHEGDHDVFKARDSLASALRRQSKFQESETLFQINLDAQERILGELHPITLGTINELGWMLYLKGNCEEAEKLLRRAKAGREEVLTPSAGPTQHTYQNLAACLTKLGGAERLKEAEELYTLALEGHLKIFGPKQFWVLHIKSNLANLEAQGKYAETIAMYQEVLEGRKVVLGRTHHDTLMTASLFLKLLIRQKQLERAERMAQEMYEFCKEDFGSDCEETFQFVDLLVEIRSTIAANDS
ncbi:hypothetical protein FGG08_005736 [Glutinoglossum americanum]|uniref:NB-ARC domain-containing protein n=1 Tax=Glutinoglossum americanum TaxID=1670608 RepID=A0A9P8KY78_9PEZI|nr:hypothetical protein FGG08_005736 [Glutinoglossum americanum]